MPILCFVIAFWALLCGAASADNITVPLSFFGFNLASQSDPRPVYISETKHLGGNWNNIASCRPTNPTNPADPCYSWGAMDSYLTFAQANNYNIEYVLGFAPTWSNGSQTTQYPPTDLTDYTNWVTAYLTRYANKIDAVEVWNEVSDSTSVTGYAGSMADLLTMENSLCAVAHAISPKTKVLSPSTYYGNGLTYHAKYFASGGGQCVDGFAWHNYPLNVAIKDNLEQWDNTTRFYQALLAQYGRAGKPIYVTEGGYSNSISDPVAMGALDPLFMACFATVNMPYAWDRPAGGNTSLDYWLGAANPTALNGRGMGYKAMQSWLAGATITQCPTRTATTNMARNPNGTGFTAGVIGSGGAVPTSWGLTAPDSGFGVTTQIVGSCTNGAATGVAFRIYGAPTAGASGSTSLAFESNGQVTGTLGAQYNIGATVSLVGGSMNNVGAQFAYNEYTSGNGYLASTMGASNAPVVPLATPVYWNWKANVANATAAYIIPKIGFSYTVGNAFDVTVCISGASVDTGSIWTATITRPGGYQGLIAWDSNGGPTTYSVPGTYAFQRDAMNTAGPIVGNSSVLGKAPVLFENQAWKGWAP
ncbi:hypothetical protein [Rhodoblastus sp.]|jgi:hypothetical protein|uniref:hypothetical protein n=1 Tax=Rhodoblastus sp. TaxID=1962975 RepID=UPI0025CCC2F4|nr:hypothetical protein [Rhodoblastus sp.]